MVHFPVRKLLVITLPEGVASFDDTYAYRIPIGYYRIPIGYL